MFSLQTLTPSGLQQFDLGPYLQGMVPVLVGMDSGVYDPKTKVFTIPSLKYPIIITKDVFLKTLDMQGVTGGPVFAVELFFPVVRDSFGDSWLDSYKPKFKIVDASHLKEPGWENMKCWESNPTMLFGKMDKTKMGHLKDQKITWPAGPVSDLQEAVVSLPTGTDFTYCTALPKQGKLPCQNLRNRPKFQPKLPLPKNVQKIMEARKKLR